MSMLDTFRAAVRRAVGLDPAVELPVIDRLAFYRAEVKAATSDGKTVDLQPEDSRIEGHSSVPVHTGIPGAVVVVQPGAVMFLGWDRGDPAKPIAVPFYESGATVTKLTLTATTIELTGNTVLKLNGGTLGAARQTDQVTGTAGPYPISGGQIAGGSTKVKIG